MKNNLASVFERHDHVVFLLRCSGAIGYIYFWIFSWVRFMLALAKLVSILNILYYARFLVRNKQDWIPFVLLKVVKVVDNSNTQETSTQ